MLIYWHDCCAVCGRSLQDLFGEVKQHNDHWIPVSDPRPGNPGTVATNIVPLCNRCNSTKSSKDPRQWLIERFGGRKAKVIITRIEAYFDWLRQQG
jgi:5-methylcytosine-specific restriction endonuclease McrA